MNKLCCRAEVLGDVEGGFVIGLYTKVLDVHVTVVISASKHIIKLSLCCIKDMCDAQIPQARTLQSCFPATQTQHEAAIMGFDTCALCVHLLTHPRCRDWARPG